MKRKDLDKIRVKSEKELNDKVAELRKKLVDLKMEASLGKLKNTKEVKMKRRNLSQLLTVLREKELNENA